ncbi:MAG: 3-hydroxyacyl-CoA dehydrogenase family protein, partial [bacterium]|nr:3-hydroxyacyl-CoA dehydrogenase family protein [bacterium]
MLERIGILGAGTMGHGIAEAFAIHGYTVHLYEPDDKIRDSAKDLISRELRLLAKEDLIQENKIQEILERIILFNDLSGAMKDRDYVLEATPEVMEIKQSVFYQLDQVCPPGTIIATNTSSLKLMEIGVNLPRERKERIMVCHWYNPGHIMPIAELSFFGNMPEAVYIQVRDLYKSIGKHPVKVLKDIPGLLANRIQQAVAREGFALIEMEAASPEDIDKALVYGPAFRYATTGQLEIADFGGLDIWGTVGDNLLSVMDNSRQANELIKTKVKEKKLG